MKKKFYKKIVLLILSILIMSFCFFKLFVFIDRVKNNVIDNGENSNFEEHHSFFPHHNKKDKNESLYEIEVLDEDECIYDPGEGYGYRYGPSMIINDDGSIDAWFSRPGNSSTMWDYISYRHRDSDGNWGDEEIVLYPTEGSKDHYSVCDPGVIYLDGYYYLGYTSTESSDGMQNQIYVARSSEPNGYYEKWNGSGWGGNPQPIITYEGEQWGAGEISFIIDGDEIFCYYTWKDEEGNSMRCSKAPISEDWPSDLSFRCICSKKDSTQCSSDVVYIDGYYLAFSIDNRMLENSYLLVEYSKDGREFTKLCEVKENIKNGAHNLGITKHKNGSIFLDDDLYICYAYSDDDVWGRWETLFQKIAVFQN